MAASFEREAKLLAPVDFTVPSMRDVVDGVTDDTPVRLELAATYYDTEDLALARAGITLRYRSGAAEAQWTVKLGATPSGSRLTRLEVNLVGRPTPVPKEARDLVRAYARSSRLQRVARLHTERTAVPLLGDDGQPVAELTDDKVTAFEGNREIATFREIELELHGTRGMRRLQRAVVRRLVAAGCEPAEPLPKLVRVLGERATAPPDLVVAPLGKAPTVSDAVRHALTTSVDRLLRHDAGVRLGDDPEDVHQFRVAARTLRSNLKTFGHALDPTWARGLRAELGWLGTSVGTLRDLDVLDNRLRQAAAKLDDQDAAGLDALFGHLAGQRAEARTQALAALRSRRYDSLVDTLILHAEAPVAADGADVNTSARAFLRRAARTQVRRLDRALAAAADPPSDIDLHLIRIQAKRTRYVIEAAEPLLGKPARAHAAALAHLQDILGDYHDSIVATQWLRAAAAAQPSCGVAAGQLVAAESRQRRRLRRQVRRAVRAVEAKRLRKWL